MQRNFLIFLTLSAALIGGCGDPPLSKSDATAASDVGLVVNGDVSAEEAGADGGSDNGDDVATADTAVADSVPTDAPAVDAAASDAPVADIPIVDTLSPDDTGDDVALQTFEVVGSVPADGSAGLAQPLIFTIEFNDVVKGESFTPYTAFVKTSTGDEVAGSWLTTEKKVTFTASASVPFATRINVTLTNLIQAKKGNSLQDQKLLHFYTMAMPKMEPYAKLAARYAPTIRQGLNDGGPKYDVMRAIDFDDNWNLSDNLKNTALVDPVPTVAWSVIESQSHFYIFYVFYWPSRIALDAGVAYDNDSAGSLVTIEKYPVERPVALTTYFKAKGDEEMWTWITSESGLPSAKNPFIRGVLAQDQLFPKAGDPLDQFGCESVANCVPRRYPAYLTAGNHQSCLWLDGGDAGAKQCVNNAFTQSNLIAIDFKPSDKPIAIKAKGANPPLTALYGLQHLDASWWPHRDEAGETALFADSTFQYVGPPGRPAGPKQSIGGKFFNKNADFSRPPWAWRWLPTSLSQSYYDMPRGTPFYDPAFALFERLGGDDKKLPVWNPTTKTGFSQDYCLQAFFQIDKRDEANCLYKWP